MISKETIDKIFSAIRIEDIVGEYVQLKRAGTNLKGLSPFQDEKTPSFVVSPSKQIWKDFSSGKGGTAISFLMEMENFTYPEALRYAAKMYGIEIEEDRREYTEEEKKQQSERELLYKIHEVAQDFFEKNLWESEEGQAIGYSYFQQRALKDTIVKKFQLGYSPEQKDAFTHYALEKGYSKEILEKSGLSIFPENAKQGIDRFRERVIFPIHSFSGRVLGFGARVLKNNVKTAKYLNSPETDIYHKSNVLYGLFQSKQAISKKDKCLLVEGYMDVISLHQAGIDNVVASSGTSITTDQIKLIKRLTENVTLLFDGDKAGIKASFRSIDLLLAQGMNIRVLLFPDGDDPDSFSRKHTQEDVEHFIEHEAKDFINFKAEILLDEAGNDPIKKAEAIRDIIRSVANVQNALKQEVYLKEVAQKFELSEQILSNELHVQKQITQKNNTVQPPRKEEKKVNLKIVAEGVEESINPLLVLEEKLVELILKYGDHILTKKLNEQEKAQITVAEEIIYYLKEDQYEILSPLNKNIIDEIESGLKQGELRKENFFLQLLDENITEKVASVLVEKYTTSDWNKHNIYFKKEEDVIPEIVNEVLLRHKRAFIFKLVEDLKKEGVSEEESDDYYEKIQLLSQLKIQIDQETNRIL